MCWASSCVKIVAWSEVPVIKAWEFLCWRAGQHAGMANWRDGAGLQVVTRAVLKTRAKELEVWVAQLCCKKSAEKMWFCMTSVPVVQEHAGLVLRGGPPEEQARQWPFCVPWISSWIRNLSSLCAAEPGVAESAEAEPRTGWTGVPCWLSCSRNFCWMLLEAWAGWKMFLMSLSCLDLKFLFSSLPFLSCRLFCWHKVYRSCQHFLC